MRAHGTAARRAATSCSTAGSAPSPRYVTDLGDCAPAGAMSYDPQHGRWRLIDYETDALNGTMLVGDPETHAPPVTYPLRAEGLHAVSIGVYGCPEGPIDAAGPGAELHPAPRQDDGRLHLLHPHADAGA